MMHVHDEAKPYVNLKAHLLHDHHLYCSGADDLNKIHDESHRRMDKAFMDEYLKDDPFREVGNDN